MAILAQNLPIRKDKIPALMQAFRVRGCVTMDITHVDPSLVFDVADEKDEMIFCRFLCSEIGDIRGIQLLDQDHYGLERFLDIMRPFLDFNRGRTYILFTGEHQEEIEGYQIQQDGIYHAVDIRITFEMGIKREVEK